MNRKFYNLKEAAPGATGSSTPPIDPLDAKEDELSYQERLLRAAEMERELARRQAGFEKEQQQKDLQIQRAGLDPSLAGSMEKWGETFARGNRNHPLARLLGKTVGIGAHATKSAVGLGRSGLNVAGGAIAGKVASGVAQLPSFVRSKMASGTTPTPKPPTPTPTPKPPTPTPTPKPPTPKPPTPTPTPKPPTPTPTPKPPTPTPTPKPPTPTPTPKPSVPPGTPTVSLRDRFNRAVGTAAGKAAAAISKVPSQIRSTFSRQRINDDYQPNEGYHNLRMRLNEKYNSQSGCKRNMKKYRKNLLIKSMNEEAPANSVGSGQNIAGINPPAGPGPLTKRDLKGLAAGMSPTDLAKKHNVSLSAILKQLKKGQRVEREHTDNPSTAMKIAMDHVFEDPKYYDKLQKMEQVEAGKRDIGNDTVFNSKDPQAKFRVKIGQTRCTTDAHPGNPGIDHA